MSSRVVKQLYKKEMLDVLRDKKTIIMMLIVPLLVYPLMFIVGLQLMTKVATELDTQTYKVALIFEDEDDVIANILLDENNDEWAFEIVEVEDAQAALRNSEINAAVSMEMKDGKPSFVITYISAVTNSNYAADKLQSALNAYARMLTEKQLEQAGLDAKEVLAPIEVKYQDLASKEESTGSLLGMIIPFMLVVSLLMGTMYPAIDTTAGERERGTLETLLTLPISNEELVMSKFLTVATIGIASAILNLISMGGLGVYMYHMTSEFMGASGGVKISSFVPALLICILCVLAFAVLISALSMCFCVFAKTYKEANNYITPLMLVVMFASFIGMMPNVELTRNMALLPVANICLLIRDLLSFKFSFHMITIVLFSNIAYGVLAVLLLGKIYNSEAVLFGDSVSGTQIFERRSNMKKGGVPAKGDAWFVLSVVLMLMIYLGGLFSMKNVYVGLICTQLIVAGIPMLAAIYTKKDLKKTFRIRGCHPLNYLGGAVMIFGALLVGMLVTAITSAIFKNNATELSQSMQDIMNVGFAPSLLLMALLPAVCEELLFRGFLFSSLEANMKPQMAMLITAALFGAYHMNMVQSITTALLGYVICYLSYKSKSIFPGMLMHFINNGFSCLVSFYPNTVNKVLPFLSKESLSYLDLGLILVVGCLLLYVGRCFVVKGNGKVKEGK